MREIQMPGHQNKYALNALAVISLDSIANRHKLKCTKLIFALQKYYQEFQVILCQYLYFLAFKIFINSPVSLAARILRPGNILTPK